MHVEVNYKSCDDRLYRLTKEHRLAKIYNVVSWRVYHKILSTHWFVTVPLASRIPMNGGSGEKEEINGRESRKRGKEWTNRKERGRFGKS